MAAVDAIVEAVDLTEVLDPAALWPEPEACPDWPILPPNYPGFVPRGRSAAEQRLAAVSRHLNREPGRLRSPSAKERRALQAAHFRQGSDPSCARYGIDGLGPIHPYQPGQAPLMAEAALIRGYLRKLDAQAARAAEAAEAARVEGLKRRLTRYEAALPDVEAKLKAAAEGAERHRQRIADDKAFHDEINLTRQITDMHRDAVSAANDLGIDPPSRPEAVK